MIFDALDEMADSRDMQAFIKALSELDSSLVRTIVTICDQEDIIALMSSVATNVIQLHDLQTGSDMRLHLENQLAHDLVLSRLPQSLKNEISETLISQSHGM